MDAKKKIHTLAQYILDKHESTEVRLTKMTLRARPGVPDFQFAIERAESRIFLKGTELILQLSFNGYRVVLLDTYHYGCAVYIATFSVTELEIKKIQNALGGKIEECIEDPGDLIDGIMMPERRRLLGANG
ncbi:hypothetical protein [secondary endosymbiont of Ctenarytaina eucalypti]|uniref:Uncharacterized protein n=1 Tax=secondary endosymbiont of Ctenarytaina eucalypti TaxID=1199245 RepID=J3YRV6_9ENTR|nr:hypothetical protein [secondary endosymbiont of Ctenarytaina eucalypti]AFP84848.1 hypothetical protein A359_04550 [secondary endosymbiont of Ctenarytaina eucalypti]